MNKYENGKIYKLVGENDLWYIGSTIQSLNTRLSEHYRNIDCMSRYLINPQIELIEEYPCCNATELRQREQYYIAKYRDKCINYKNAYRSEEERKEQVKQCAKKYEEKLKGQNVECECGLEVSKRNITQHKKTKKHLTYLQKKNDI